MSAHQILGKQLWRPSLSETGNLGNIVQMLTLLFGVVGA